MKKVVRFVFSRYTISIFLIILEIIQILAVCLTICYFVPYFWILFAITNLVLVVLIINMKVNPEYKLPWLLVVIFAPPLGALLFSIFYQRKLTKTEINNLFLITSRTNRLRNNLETVETIKENSKARQMAYYLEKSSNAMLCKNTTCSYYSMGQEMYEEMLFDLKRANNFILMEYFIINEGVMWNSILEILKKKAEQGVEVKILFDDVGCMRTLSPNYEKVLQEFGIEIYRFAKITAHANPKHNNRDHRKIMVVDGLVGYTGGMNIADEYINVKEKCGVWKDGGIRLEGDAVNALTLMFLESWDLTSKQRTKYQHYLATQSDYQSDELFIPFGDGPKPFYEDNVAKNVIETILNQASKYVYIMTPYLIVDSELTNSIINASKRGVDVRIITPYIPDKKFIQTMTRSSYKQLMEAGVKLFEYKPGFIHSKVFLADDEIGVIGTVNLDYRSLTHHFENAVYIYKAKVLEEVKGDFDKTFEESILVDIKYLKESLSKKVMRVIVKVFSPLL